MDKNKSRPKKQEYDGVIYEPSNQYDDDEEDYLAPSKPKKKQIKSTSVPTKSKPHKSQYKSLMMITIISGILICIIVFLVVYFSIAGAPQKSISQINTTETTTLSVNEIIANAEKINTGLELTGIIESIDTEKKLFSIYALKENTSYNLKASGATILKDKYDGNLVISEFKQGDIIDFAFDEDKKLTSIRQSKNSWEYKNETGIKIDTDSKTVIRNSVKFNYNDKTIVKYNNKDYDISLINELDLITIKGYANNVYSINVEKSHGTIQINNASHIKDGAIEIDTSIYKKISEVDSITVSEGTHKIVVRGSNSEAFSQEIYVKAGEIYNVDLSSVQLKSGILLIKTNVSDFTLYINNEIELSREPLILDYGAYSVKVEKEGYVSYETQFSINKDQTTLNINLEKIEQVVPKGTIKITTVPPNANLYIDNTYIGISPMTKEVEYGTHSITVRLDGYKEVTLDSININSKDTIPYKFELQPQTQPQTETETTT